MEAQMRESARGRTRRCGGATAGTLAGGVALVALYLLAPLAAEQRSSQRSRRNDDTLVTQTSAAPVKQPGNSDSIVSAQKPVGDDRTVQPAWGRGTPPNDDCVQATPVSVPSASDGTTLGATLENVSACGTGYTTPGVWYQVIGTGHTISATTCTDRTNYDTRISVYCPDCETLTCVTGNDDAPGAPPECELNGRNLKSTVTWCSQLGATYLILVHGYGGHTGEFELDITEDEITCAGAVVCGGVAVAACCAPYYCTEGFVCGGNVPLCNGLFSPCVCLNTAEGGVECVDMWAQGCGDWCPNGSSDCPAGSVCVVDTCCTEGMPVCMRQGCPLSSAVAADPSPGERGPLGDVSLEQLTRGGGTSAACRHLDQDSCLSFGGLFQGDEATCENTICPTEIEACCLPSEDCINTDHAACYAADGMPQGPDTTCANTICPTPTGACCIVGVCVGNSEEVHCLAHGGEWYVREDCRDFICPAPSEACCSVDDRCLDVLPDACLQMSGVPQGPGTHCLGDHDGDGIDDACQFEPPCEDCGPGARWIDQCAAGYDHMVTGALIGIDLGGDCVADTSLILNGPVHIQRSDPLDDSNHYPGLAPVDGHLEVIDTEILSMSLSGGGVTMIAGGGLGQGGILGRSPGAIAEQPDDPTLADSFFDVFFEVDLGGGVYGYNQDALRLATKIDCVPPDAVYVHPIDCVTLYSSPVPHQGDVVAYLVRADHSTYPECGDPTTGDCFEPNQSPYCDNERCCEEVCQVLPHCCDVIWAPDCADAATEICAPRILRAIPENEHSLWRSQHNIVRIYFDRDIPPALPGQVQIREMLDGGLFGPDLSNQFSFTVEGDLNADPRILRIWENGTSLSHRRWYAISNLGGWPPVMPFELQYVVQVGDAGDDGQVLAYDVSVINAGIPTYAASDDERRDLNGDGRILGFDVRVANGSIPSFTVAKPSGH